MVLAEQILESKARGYDRHYKINPLDCRLYDLSDLKMALWSQLHNALLIFRSFPLLC